MHLRVEVPATLSNLGPGFDVLGLAIDWTNTFDFEPARGWFAEGEPLDPSAHLCLATAQAAGERFGCRIEGLSVRQEERIPRARGLGSSATARVAGLLAWRAMSGVAPPVDDLLGFLAEQEGHPDNAVPAFVGGLVLCATGAGGLRHLRFAPPDVQIALCIPSVEVSTDEARRILPVDVARADAVFNVSRVAFLVAGLLGGDPEAIALGLDDRLHQPWRKGLIGPVDAAYAAAVEAGALGAFVSGSGSTLAAFVGPGVDAIAVAEALAAPFVRSGIPCDRRAASPNGRGAAEWRSTSR